MYAVKHKQCGSVIGYYSGDMTERPQSAYYTRIDGTNPLSHSRFRETCSSCGFKVRGFPDMTLVETEAEVI